VVVDDLNLVRVSFTPDETKAPPIVDADAMLPSPSAMQRFQAISRRGGKVAQFGGAVQLSQLPACHEFHCLKPVAALPAMKRFGLGGSKRPDHHLEGIPARRLTSIVKLADLVC